MKLVAMLSWYNEPASWLTACVASLARIGVSHVVALDGAYALFPDGRARSNLAEAMAIMQGAEAVGIGCTIMQPATVWYGNEQEKRTRLFQTAAAMCDVGEDWLVAIDADEVITSGTPRILDELERTDAHVVNGHIEQWWDDVQVDAKKAEIARMFPHPTIIQHTQTRFFRVLENMRCETTHYTYVGELNGETWSLRGDKAGRLQGFTPAPIVTPDERVVFEHRDPLRDLTRRQTKQRYYQLRDQMGIERVTDPATA